MVGFAWRNRTDFTTAHRILQLPVGSRAFINNCRTEHFQIGLEAGKATRPDGAVSRWNILYPTSRKSCRILHGPGRAILRHRHQACDK